MLTLLHCTLPLKVVHSLCPIESAIVFSEGVMGNHFHFLVKGAPLSFVPSQHIEVLWWDPVPFLSIACWCVGNRAFFLWYLTKVRDCYQPFTPFSLKARFVADIIKVQPCGVLSTLSSHSLRANLQNLGFTSSYSAASLYMWNKKASPFARLYCKKMQIHHLSCC